jgi:predicted Zn-dependent protease with MMP-like domain
MERKAFEELVAEALSGLPKKVRERLNNVAVCVELRPSREQLRDTGTRKNNVLLGLYEGIPEIEWGKGFGGMIPDKITIFQESLEEFAESEDELKKLVADTVRHEIAHHFGWTDKDLP